jgi:hypothetical protein
MTARAFCGHCGADWSDTAPPCSCRIEAERVVAGKPSSSMLERFALYVAAGIDPTLAGRFVSGRSKIGAA